MEKGSESMKINIKNCFQKNVWITLVLACFAIYSVTFFLTANPFSAIHSGRAASVSYTHLDVYKRQALQSETGSLGIKGYEYLRENYTVEKGYEIITKRLKRGLIV